MWIVLAMLSAGFAALTGIFAKLGMEGINSNLATAIRTVVVLVMAWGIVFLTGKQAGIADITAKGLPDPLRGGHGPELAVLFLCSPAGRGQ